MTSSTPHVAIVTGGSGGIGRAVVRLLADEGYALVVNYAGSQTELPEAAVAEATAAGASAIAAQADVADEHAVAAMFELTEQTFGGIDVVINAAGTDGPGAARRA